MSATVITLNAYMYETRFSRYFSRHSGDLTLSCKERGFVQVENKYGATENARMENAARSQMQA